MPKISRNLTPDEQKAILKLRKLAKNWPKTLQLFSANSTLLVIDPKTHQVFDTILFIPNDGGDTKSHYENNIEYLDIRDNKYEPE